VIEAGSLVENETNCQTKCLRIKMATTDSSIPELENCLVIFLVPLEIDGQEGLVSLRPDSSNRVGVASPHLVLLGREDDGREGTIQFAVSVLVCNLSKLALCRLEWCNFNHIRCMRQRFSEPR